MSDPLTPNLGLTLPMVGGDDDVWGDLCNENFILIDGIGASLPSKPTTSTTIVLQPGPETFVLATGGAGGISQTLPSAASSQGKVVTVKKIDSGIGFVTVVGTIDGQVNYILSNQFQFVRLYSDGGGWNVVGNN